MPRYDYVARNESGTATTGEIVAPSQAEAAKLLRSSGKFVVKLEAAREKTAKTGKPVKRGSRRVKQTQVIYFANQLAIMVDTGVPLAQALKASVEGEPPSGFRTVIEDIINQVQAGQQFSAALARHPRIFPKYFSNIIRASEASGLLGSMLHRAAAYMNNQLETRKRIKGAMAYPLAMICFCVLVAIFLLTFLLPKFIQIFESRGADLPGPTVVLISVSQFLVGNGVWLGPLVIGLIVAAVVLGRKPGGRRVVSWLKINTPLIGPMYRKSYITMTMRTMGTLIDSGVSMLETIAITREIVGNQYYEHLFDSVDQQLRKGSLLSDSLKGSDLYPHTVVQMILAGERAGQMGTVMNRVADFCEQDLANAVKTTTQLIEPALVVFMGAFIGGVVMALLLPIFSLSRVISGSS